MPLLKVTVCQALPRDQFGRRSGRIAALRDSVGFARRDYIICYETLTVASPKPLQLQKLLPRGGGIGNPRVPRVAT